MLSISESLKSLRNCCGTSSAVSRNDLAKWTSRPSVLRLHQCLRARGHTAKSLEAFLADADPDGAGTLTLHKLHRISFA